MSALQEAEAAVSVADLAERASKLFGPGFSITSGEPPASMQSHGFSAPWLTAVVDRGPDAAADQQRTWRATLAIGFIRDAAATRGFAVPAGSTLHLPDDGGEEGPDPQAGTLQAPGPPGELTGTFETDENAVAEQLRAAAAGASLDVASLDFIRSIYPIPLIHLTVRGDAESAVRGLRHSGLLPTLEALLEGIWIDLDDSHGVPILRLGSTQRLGRGSVWVDPKYDAAWRDG